MNPDTYLYAFDTSWDPGNPRSLDAPDNWSRVIELP